MKDSFDKLRCLFYLVRHHGSVFSGKVRSLPPLVLWIFTLYQIFDPPIPSTLIQGYVAAAMWLFFAMVWFGYLFLSDFDMTTEHLLILQINSRLLYVISKILFLTVVCFAISLLGALYPIIMDFAFGIIGLTLIADGVRLSDFFGALLLNFTVGTLGVSVAFLFHPNPSKNSDSFITLIMLVMFALMAFIKHQIFNFEGLFRYLLLIFTPVYEILRLFSDKSVFTVGDLAMTAIQGSIYFSIAMMLGYWLYSRRVYGPLLAKPESG